MTRKSTRVVCQGMTKKEGDRIADMVLALVRAVVEQRQLADLPLEPTGTGYLAGDVRRYVMERSA